MMITVNGEPKQFTQGTTVGCLVQQHSQRECTHGIAVAINGHLIRQGLWETTIVTTNDRVEILQAVAGG